MIVERELEIRAFVPEDYLEVVATFAPPRAKRPSERLRRHVLRSGRSARANAQAKRCRPTARRRRRSSSGRSAAARAIESVERQTRRLPPPLLYDLTELQRHANRLYGFTAQRTLETRAERCTKRQAPQLSAHRQPPSLARHRGHACPASSRRSRRRYAALARRGTGTRPLGAALRRRRAGHRSPRHHPDRDDRPRPICRPTSESIYDLVCRRLLSAWHGDHVYAVTTVMTAITPSDVRRSLTRAGHEHRETRAGRCST